MDAVEFVTEYNRMCDFYDSKCSQCQMYREDCDLYCSETNISKLVSVVKKWSEEHVPNTRQEKFLEKFPNAILCDGVAIVCPNELNSSVPCPHTCCTDCRRTYWLAPAEEEEMK